MPASTTTADSGSTPISLQFTRLTLLTLTLLGVYTIQIFARTNSLFDTMERFQAKLTLPDDGRTSFNPLFTGVKAIDDVAGFVLMFFWPFVDGRHPGLSVCGAAFGGQGVAVWVLMMIEGRRRGPGGAGGWWNLLSYTSVVGIMGQLLGLGVIGPAYLLLHSWSRPLALSPTASTLSSSLTTSLAAIPASIAVAYVLPMIFMSLPTTLIMLDQKIIAHNLWQLFPFTCAIMHGFLSMIWPYNPAPTPQNTLRYLRIAYKFALTIAAPAHIAATTLSVSSFLFPGLFSPGVAESLQPQNVFFPSGAPFRPGVKAGSVAEGALWFIQWDYALVGVAYLTWGVMLRQLGRRAVHDSEGFGVGGLFKVATRVAVLGPVGAAVAYVWERDELVLGAAEVPPQKKTL